MRRITMAAALVAMMMFAAVPVLADDIEIDGDSFDDDGGSVFFSDDDDGGFFISNGSDDDDDDDSDFFISDGFDNDDIDFDSDNGGDVAVQEFGQESESGDAEVSFEATSTGDNSNQCVPANQFVNTGNLQNAQGFVQYASESDDVEFEGSSFEFGPETAVECTQSVEQAAAAG